MKRHANIAITAIALTVVLAGACRDDIVLEPLPTLEGTYDGKYLVISQYNTPQAESTLSSISMQFSDESYWFDSDNDPDAFCSPRGDYILTNTIELKERIKNCTVTAAEKDNPRGIFSIRRPADSVIMLQQDTTTLKQILLKKR